VAGRSEVEVLISADSTKIEKAFSNVGSSAKAMANDLDKAESDAKSFGAAMDKAGDVTDGTEGKFGGMADVLDGLGGAFGLPTEGATNMMRSFADLGGGFGQILPMIGKMGGSLGALATGPVGLIIGVIGLLAAGLVLAYQKSETFRDIVQGVFEKVKAVVGPIIDGIGKALSWVGGLFGKSGDDAKDMSDVQKAAAESSQKAWDDWKNSVSSSLDSIMNPLQRARENSKTSLADINANLIDNQKFFAGWITNLTILTERGFGELATILHQLGPEAEKAVGEAIKLSDPELRKMQTEWSSRFGQAGAMAGDLLVQGVGNKPYSEIGRTIGQKIVGGIREQFEPGSLGHKLVTGGGLLGPAFPARAAGGPVTARQPYLVGERGPELFVPATSGAIVPSGGGGTTVIQLVLDGRVVTEVVHDGLLAKQRRTPLGLAS